MVHDTQNAESAAIRSGVDSGSNRDGVELSLVVPIYNEEQVIPHFFERVLPILSSITDEYEIVCVNDGSSDGTLESLRKVRTANDRVVVIDLARNFGKEVALTAGIDYARGQAVIPMDVDLQDPPELIAKMVERWREGFDVVLAAREDRSSDAPVKRVSARLFYKAMSKFSDTPIPPDVGDFRLMSRAVVDAVRMLPERTRFMKGIFAWVGYRQATVYFTRPSRVAGKTKWRLWPLWNFALEGIVSFTTLPLKIWSYIGFTSALVGLTYMIYIVGRTLFTGVDVPGYASLLSFILLFNGLVLAGLGVMGEYIARIFIEVKQRPLYFVRETWGVKDNSGRP